MKRYESKEALVNAFAQKLMADGQYKGSTILGEWDAVGQAKYLLSFVGDRQHQNAAIGVPEEARWVIGGNASFGYAI